LNLTRKVLVAVACAAAITAGAHLSIPMVPVPTTGQTLAVALAGLFAGPRLAAAGAGLYLLMVLLGLPVLAGGERLGGAAFFQSLTAGYVIGFIPAAFIIGWLGRRGAFLWPLLAGLAGHAAVFAFGVPVLAITLGWGDAIAHGLLPFLPGAVAKSAVAAGVFAVWQKRRGTGRVNGP